MFLLIPFTVSFKRCLPHWDSHEITRCAPTWQAWFCPKTRTSVQILSNMVTPRPSTCFDSFSIHPNATSVIKVSIRAQSQKRTAWWVGLGNYNDTIAILTYPQWMGQKQTLMWDINHLDAHIPVFEYIWMLLRKVLGPSLPDPSKTIQENRSPGFVV